MNAWRKELRGLLDGFKGRRPAALRRSRRAEYLYATDLPDACGEAAAELFQQQAEALGWQVSPEDGWLQMDRETAEAAPPEGWFEGPFGPEAACCASLGRRHPEQEEDAEEKAGIRRKLVKAGEEGPAAYERACGEIHRAWAERLRQGKKLPGIREIYFTGRDMHADSAYRTRGISDGDGKRGSDRHGSV